MPEQSPISSVNDFVVRFANVNGSGSASANELFALADPEPLTVANLATKSLIPLI